MYKMCSGIFGIITSSHLYCHVMYIYIYGGGRKMFRKVKRFCDMGIIISRGIINDAMSQCVLSGGCLMNFITLQWKMLRVRNFTLYLI